MELESIFLFAMQNGYFDDVPVNKVRACQAAMGEYFETRKNDILDNIRNNKPDLKKDAAANAAVKTALTDFKTSWK
jgi:F-type H+-transporting ATPase subunit alpha